jgi:plastocyanin
LLLVLLPLAGCGKSDQSAPPPRPVASGSGIIQGQVFFAAAPPPRPILSPPGYWATVTDDTVIVNPNGTLKDVLIYLKDAPPGDGGGPPVVLDQHNAQYDPHVLALQVGQPLIIRNSDAHMHNIHFKSAINPEQNFGMMDVGELPPITFKAPEIFEIKCDVHPWMDAEIGVFDHPYFAVTDSDGTFTISNIPPGQYTLISRHERYGELTQSVTIADKRTTTATFKYQPPASTGGG